METMARGVKSKQPAVKSAGGRKGRSAAHQKRAHLEQPVTRRADVRQLIRTQRPSAQQPSDSLQPPSSTSPPAFQSLPLADPSAVPPAPLKLS